MTMNELVKIFTGLGVEIFGDDYVSETFGVSKAEEWHHEYLAMKCSVKVVKDVDEAISHINHYGSGHTDAIITENKATAERFMTMVDSGSVLVNCSTRFADGFRFDAVKYIYYGDTDKSVEFWKWYLEELRASYPDIYCVGECWSGEAEILAYYTADRIL